MTHVHGRPDNEQEHLDDILGRGPGDPDAVGHYPGEKPEDVKYVGEEKPKVEHHQPDNEIEGYGEIPF